MNHDRTIRNDLFRHEEGVFTSTPALSATSPCVYIVRGDAVSHCTSLACYTVGRANAATAEASQMKVHLVLCMSFGLPSVVSCPVRAFTLLSATVTGEGLARCFCR